MEIEHIRQLTNNAINYLIEKKSSQGHWEDIRSTALSIFAFNEATKNNTLLPEAELTLIDILKDSKAWLFGQARREAIGISWNSEVWDTAFSVLALIKDERYGDKVDLAISWLKNQRSESSNSWYEEIWETVLATIAIIRYEQSLGVRKFKDITWIDAVVTWICHFPSETNGMFMTPHYSGFLIWLLVELKESHLTNLASYALLADKVAKAIGWAVGITNTDRKLWSEYIYANSYLLHALTRFERVERKSLGMDLRTIEHWYATNQSKNGCFEDYEDTALAILSLSSLVEASEYKERPIYAISTSKNTTRKFNCFIGYSGHSSPLAARIKDNIRHDFSNIDISDWEWDFEMGSHLFGEIDKMSQRSHLAIFLVTKDDELFINESEHQSAPRDNVIFEIGFFAARLGFNHTIMVIEKGTKIPADLGGILYIPFDRAEDISKTILLLSRNLKKLTTNDMG